MKTSLLAALLMIATWLTGCNTSTTSASNATDTTNSIAPADTSAAHPQEEAAATPLPDIPAGFAGVWVEDPANVDAAGADYEAALTICEGGRALYAVYSNQLYISLRFVRRSSLAGDVFSFYYGGTDVGRGFANAAIQTPDSGALVATGRVDGEGAGVLKMDWEPGETWVQSIRSHALKDEGRIIFPNNFYHSMVAMAGLCEETE